MLRNVFNWLNENKVRWLIPIALIFYICVFRLPSVEFYGLMLTGLLCIVSGTERTDFVEVFRVRWNRRVLLSIGIAIIIIPIILWIVNYLVTG